MEGEQQLIQLMQKQYPKMPELVIRAMVGAYLENKEECDEKGEVIVKKEEPLVTEVN